MEKDIKSFRDLNIWHKGIDLVKNVYKESQNFPREEIYGLTNQLRRAAISIPSNIAEGHTREHLNEYLQHISIAQASLAELQTQLEIAKRLSYIPMEDFTTTQKQAESLSKQLYALRNSLKKRG